MKKTSSTTKTRDGRSAEPHGSQLTQLLDDHRQQYADKCIQLIAAHKKLDEYRNALQWIADTAAHGMQRNAIAYLDTIETKARAVLESVNGGDGIDE